jgi:transcriptional regulator
MYCPAHFREDDPVALAALIDAYPLAVVVASGPDGLIANHLPLMRSVTADGRMLLRGHLARANEMWKAVDADGAVLVIFRGEQRYVSPSWYPTKRQTGEVVPTWNYAVVHAHGRIRFEQDRQVLHGLVSDLTDRHEAGRPAPWHVSDAPAPYVDRMLSAIVGFEIEVERIEGKVKASQNRTEGERDGVRAGLEADGVAADARGMLVRDRK